jgi:hypothetical protein
MGILDNAKDIANAVHEAKNLDLYARVLDLNRGIMDLVEENRNLHNENVDLKKKLKLRETMTFNEPFYYQEGDKTPFCSACWEVQQLPVHLKLSQERERDLVWYCPGCRQSFTQAKLGHAGKLHLNEPPKSSWG